MVGHVSPCHAGEENSSLEKTHFSELEAAELRRYFWKYGVQ